MRTTRSTGDRRLHAKDLFVMHDSCPHCGKKLKRIDVVILGKAQTVTCYGSCGCEESKWDGMDVRPADRRYARAGIPAKYMGAECDLDGWGRVVADGGSLYVHGPFGAGKTYFACALAKALVNMGETVRFENSRHLIGEIQESYSGKRTDALDRAFGCRVLVLDDLGKEHVTPYSISMLYELVDTRYAAGKPMVVTSNFSRDRLLERWAQADGATAESIVSRLCEKTDVLFMDGEDRRLA